MLRKKSKSDPAKRERSPDSRTIRPAKKPISLVADKRRLAGRALPLAVLIYPGIGKTAGPGHRFPFFAYLFPIHPGDNNRNIPVLVYRHLAAIEVLIMINRAIDMSQP